MPSSIRRQLKTACSNSQSLDEITPISLPAPSHCFTLLASITIRAIVPPALSGITGAAESRAKKTGIAKVYRCLSRSELPAIAVNA
jgi:hypothetical protein